MLGHALLGAFNPKNDGRSFLKFCKYQDDLRAGLLDYSKLISWRVKETSTPTMSSEPQPEGI